MSRRLIIYVAIIQLVIVGLILVKIFNQKSNTDKTTVVNPIRSESVLATSSGGLKHFFEPKPSSQEIVDLSWLGEKYNYKVAYKINSDSLNQITNIPVERSEDVFRIIILGDSYTFGVNVNTEDNYPMQLQEILNKQCTNKFEIINLGVGGYDIQYVEHRYQLRGKKYAPDLIVWFLVGDDFLRLDELLIPRATKYGEEMRANGEYEKLQAQGIAYPSWRKAREEIVRELGGEGKVLELQSEFLRKLQDDFDKTLVYATYEDIPSRYKKFLSDISSGKGNIHLHTNVRSMFKIGNASLPDYHPNEKGHRIMAEDIFSYLNASNLIPCY